MTYLLLWFASGLLTLVMMAVVEWHIHGSFSLINRDSFYSVNTQLFTTGFVVLMGPIGFVLTAIEVPSKIRRERPVDKTKIL